MLNLNAVAAHQQIPLIHVVHEDDELLANSPEAEWYKILQSLPWEQYRSIAADYYNALYHFNKSKPHSCVFRVIPAGNSGRSRPPIPIDSVHPFRGKPSTHSGRFRPPSIMTDS